MRYELLVMGYPGLVVRYYFLFSHYSFLTTISLIFIAPAWNTTAQYFTKNRARRTSGSDRA